VLHDICIDCYVTHIEQCNFVSIGMVSCMDEAVANITKTFKNFGLWDNTVLIFSTGEMLLCLASNII